MATCETDPVTDPSIFVLAKSKNPLMPCHPARAREILAKGRAAVVRRLPFLIRLKVRTAGITQPIKLKLDPGAKTTGVALVTSKAILTLLEISHRKAAVQKKMGQRKNYRGRRRTSNLRCRQPRFDNRGRAGFIPPSIQSILNNLDSWITRLCLWAPISEIVIESSKFDSQKLQNPEISGEEYQEGTLQGFEVWEYLLAKFNHKCVYCGAGETPLTRDHVIPKCAGGSNRVSNLAVACLPCNQAKGNLPLDQFLTDTKNLSQVKAQLKKPLASSATMNILQSRIVQIAQASGLPVTLSSGAETKFNRSRFGIPKSHTLDAAFTGSMSRCPSGSGSRPIAVQATSRGSYCRTRTDKFGFPRLYLPRTKKVHGFQTGDIVHSPKGTGRISIRTSGHFALATASGKTTVKHNQCRLAQQADGYNYRILPATNIGGSPSNQL